LDVQEKDGLSQSAISEVVITQIMNPTSLQINLLNSNEKATESNVNMSFFNARTGALKYNFYHTLAASGQADSLFIDPAIRYRVKVHTLPSKTLEDVNLTVGNHTIKALETPQGQLKIQMNGNTKAKLIKAIVRQNNKTINAQELNTLQDYLVGSYDIEVLTLPALQFSNIEILQSQTKTITIPNPGILALNKGIGYLMIQKRNDKNQLETIYTMDVALKKESIQLQPGNYEIIYRSKSASSTRASIVKKVTIVSGVASTLNF
jgi:Ca-activated chloride channel family protein